MKARVVAAARKVGKSPHAFMLEAIEEETARAEKRQRFVADALDAEAETLKTGSGYRAEDVHRLMEARARGRKHSSPKARPWRK